MTPLLAGYPSTGGGSLALWAAAQLGIFRDYGLDVDLVLHPGSSAVVAALVDGDIQVANIASPALIEANLATPSADLVYLTGALNHFSHVLVAHSQLGGLADLHGKRLGARTSNGQVLDLALWRQLLRRADIDAGTDVTIVPVDTHEELVDGVVAGDMDAAVIIPPHAFEAARRGAFIVLEGPSLGIPYQLGGLVAARTYVRDHREIALAAVRAYVDGVRAVKADAELAASLVRAHGQIEHDETVRRTAEFFRRALVDPPFPSHEGIATVLDSLRDSPRARASQPADHIADDLVRELS